jgi:hypothetical protein
MAGDHLTLRLSLSAVRRGYAVLAAISALFVAATLLSDLQHPIMQQWYGRELNLKLEGNVAVWWSSIVLFIAGMAALALSRAVLELPAARWSSMLWVLMALFFVALSADETAGLHERSGAKFVQWFGQVPELVNPGFTWLLALLPLIIAFTACTFVLARWTVRWHPPGAFLLLAGLACWLGVLVAEFVQAQLVRWSLPRGFQGVIEEGLEMVGANIFVAGLMELLWTAHQRASQASPVHCRETVQLARGAPVCD